MPHIIMRASAVLTLGLALTAIASPARAGITLIYGSQPNASFTGELEIMAQTSTSATIRVLLTNTSSYDARITAFGFNSPAPTPKSAVLGVVTGTMSPGDWKGAVGVNGGSLGTLEVGVITGKNNFVGGSPNSGIPNEANDPGKLGPYSKNPAEFLITLRGTNLDVLTAANIMDAGFYVRYQRVGYKGKDSTIVTGQIDHTTNPVESVPEPSSVIMALTALGLTGALSLRNRRRRR